MNLKTALIKIPAAIGYAGGSLRRGFEAGLSGQWEGHEFNRLRRRPSRERSSQDAGLNFGVREDMLSAARTQSQTFPLGRSILRKYANHVVGSCRMKWNTGNPAIDKIYGEAWQVWMRMADLGGRHHFRKLTKIAVERIIEDGATLAQLDRREAFLQLAPIESDRVSSNGIYNTDSPGQIGGFTLDSNGRATSARVWQRTIYGLFENPTEIPRGQYIHAFDTDRFDAVTGVTHFHTVLNAVQDLKETLEAEMLAAKKNSKIAMFVKTIMGGAAPPAVDLFGNSDTTQGASKVNVEEINDVATMYGFPNEEIRSHTSDRPSAGFQWVCEWIVRSIALGLDLPFGVVWNMAALGKPAVLFEMAQANRTFLAFLEDVLEPMWLRPIVGAWITMELNAKRLPFHANWFRFAVPRPVSITIDAGRDSKSGISENFAGLSTATDWYAENDMDFEEKQAQLVHEAKVRESLRLGIPIEQVKEVPLEQIRIVTQQGNPQQADPQTAEDQTAQPATK